MTAKLLVREVGARDFIQHNSDFTDAKAEDGSIFTAVKQAVATGEQLSREGNVEAFQVWELSCAFQRAWKLEAVT